MLKKLLVSSTVAILASAGSAFAADVAGEAPVAASFDWTGAYIGANVGGGFGTFDHPFSISTMPPLPAATLATGSLDISAGGFLGGVQAGYNWQSGQFVFGVETDFQGSAVKAEDKITVNLIDPLGGPGATLAGKAGTKVDWFGTVRGRIGYAATERFMIYGTGGLAYGHLKSYINGDLTAGGAVLGTLDESASKTKAGWTIGAGAEYAIADHWTLKSEYLYTDFGKTTLYNDDLLGLPINANLKSDVAFHTFRIGLNYKF